MGNDKTIITVGFCPAWDYFCYADGIGWGEHKTIVSQQLSPAGKAFNISRALAWLGRGNIAAGLWGKDDYEQMRCSIDAIKEFVDIRFTSCPGRTRQNVNIIDTHGNREMHLRAQSQLATAELLKQLSTDLEKIVTGESLCVFAGSMPGGELLDESISIIEKCRGNGPRVAVDSSGEAMKRIVGAGGLWLIKPNVQELCDLLNQEIEDTPEALVRAARGLLDKVELVLVSRGKEGALVVCRDGAVGGKFTGKNVETVTTVGCGDYLLAGFIDGFMQTEDAGFALEKGIKVATARACGMSQTSSWLEVKNKLTVEISEIK